MLQVNKNTLYYFAYAIYIISITTEYMQVSHFVKVVLATISLFILLFEFTVFICNTNVVKKDFLKKLFLLFFFVFCAFISNDYFILMLVLFALCATKKINIDTLLKITMFCLISITLLVVFLCMTNLIPNVSTPRYLGSGDRFAYGFSHSQNLSLISFYVLFCYITLQKRVCLVTIIVSTCYFYILYLICDSRTFFYSVILFDLFVIIYFIGKKILKVNLNCNFYNFIFTTIVLYICTNFILLLLYKFDISAVDWIDKIVTTRISAPLKTINLDQLSILSNLSYTEFVTSLRSTMDNGYYYVLYRYGYLYLLFLLYSIFLLLKNFKNSNNIFGGIFLLITCISFSFAATFSLFLPFFIISFIQLKFGYNKMHIFTLKQNIYIHNAK